MFKKHVFMVDTLVYLVFCCVKKHDKYVPNVRRGFVEIGRASCRERV